jgi:CRISPR-associated protein Csm5
MMERMRTKIGVEVKLLSPLHIGTGTDLLLDYDVVPHAGRTYRVDEDVLLDQSLTRAEAGGPPAVNRVLAGRPARELLTLADFAQPRGPLFRYTLLGEPSARTPGSKVREQIKDVYDRLYLPGSSLKGALRTVLAWGFYVSEKRRPDLGALGPSRTWAAQPLERDIFGANPNRDWLRALRVEDSQPVDPAGHLLLAAIRVYPTTKVEAEGGLDVDVEAIKATTVFHTELIVDEYGFGEQTAERLGWQGKRNWLDRLPELARELAQDRLQIEASFFKEADITTVPRQFYSRLLELADGLPENEFVIQLGWGTGWESKTLGSKLLRQDEQAFERLLSTYHMTKELDREPGDPFPTSRHLVLDQNREPAVPLGWTQVRLVPT